ncbi:DUF2510 domain-containing protein [Streptomyces pactum]|uniref:DUF2510 domain-containing protein n=1 Tax=Streptomyces pactum TaxID=68249 RepID=A0ABS0NRU1_9ACTN|nr:DUF2510 domain-containing protein [Streptomyces pactum]MBH5337861.1 DUF2510 domain-containing protein [Streptomyces pactum]
MTTPPGWYPDPAHQGHGPAQERWWDGAGWTDHRRDAPGAYGAPTEPSVPGPVDAAAQHPGQAPGQLPGHPTGQGYGAGQAPGYAPGQTPGYAPGGQAPGYGAGQIPGYPPAGQAPGYGQPPAPGGAPRGRGAKIAAVAVATVVVVGAIVGGVVLLNDDEDDGKSGPKAGPSATAPGGHDSPTPTEKPSTGPSDNPRTNDPEAAEDLASGISLPVLEGWRDAATDPSAGAGVTTLDGYPCPAAPESNCVRGGVFSFPASGYKARTAEGVAKEDIAQNAESSYGTDPVSKKKSYGGITSHKQLKAEAVTVAGTKGYLVRWKVETKKGDDGYVQSVAFPSPTVPGATVVVRFGFDVSDEAPTLADMDRIVREIKPVSDPGDNEDV